VNVRLAPVAHSENAERAAIDLAAGKGRLVQQDENIERVAVFVQRARDEPVLAGVVHRRIKHAIQPEQARRLIQLVFVLAPLRDLDNRRNHVGRMRAGGEIVPRVDHASGRFGMRLSSLR